MTKNIISKIMRKEFKLFSIPSKEENIFYKIKKDEKFYGIYNETKKILEINTNRTEGDFPPAGDLKSFVEFVKKEEIPYLLNKDLIDPTL